VGGEQVLRQVEFGRGHAGHRGQQHLEP
jgi:hypothetical protein